MFLPSLYVVHGSRSRPRPQQPRHLARRSVRQGRGREHSHRLCRAGRAASWRRLAPSGAHRAAHQSTQHRRAASARASARPIIDGRQMAGAGGAPAPSFCAGVRVSRGKPGAPGGGGNPLRWREPVGSGALSALGQLCSSARLARSAHPAAPPATGRRGRQKPRRRVRLDAQRRSSLGRAASHTGEHRTRQARAADHQAPGRRLGAAAVAGCGMSCALSPSRARSKNSRCATRALRSPAPSPTGPAWFGMTRHSLRHAWACLHFPDFSLQLALRASPSAGPTIITTGGNPPEVLSCNPERGHHGLTPGMTVSAAIALVPELVERLRAPALEMKALEGAAAWAGQFTSTVSLAQSDALLLEIEGSLRLFGGLRPLLLQLARDLNHLGYTAAIAVAPTPTAAKVLARAGMNANNTDAAALETALTGLPLCLLEQPEDVIRTLGLMGVHTLGECLALPRDGLARRFGQALLDELDRALGRLSDPRAPWVAPSRYKAQ